MKYSFPPRLFQAFLAVVLGLFLFAVYSAQQEVQAAPSGITVTIYAAPNLVVDSNVMSPSTQAPEVATVVGRFCNTSGVDLDNIIGYIGDYNEATPANSQPGVYPSKSNITLGTPPASTTYTGSYAFTHLGGTSDAIRIIGTLTAGECSYQYWSFSYPKTANNGTIPTWGTSVSPIDDLYLDFDVWAAQGTVCGTAETNCHKTFTATMRNEISAMANKIEPNGNPGGQWFNTSSQTVQVGQTITTNGIRYRLGNINQGFDNNGDLVPDYNAWLQPIGNPTYDPSCFRLVEVSGVLTVTRSAGNPDMIIPFNHDLNKNSNTSLLYFTDLPADNTDVNGLVYYTFMALGGPCTIPISPYQEVASGSDNEKFNGDYGGGGPSTIETYAPNITFDKNGPTSTSVSGANFTYSISYTNNGSTTMGLSLSSGLNAGFVVSDAVPIGLNYVGNSAGGTPPSGNSYKIYFSTNGGVTWSTTDPGTVQSTAANQVMIQWWLTQPLDKAGSGKNSGTATFQAAAPANYYAAGGTPFIENCSEARLGTGHPFAEDCAVTIVQGTGTIGDLVWADDKNTTGIANNGIQDGNEAGITAVAVNLYWDKNGNGLLDASDVLVETQDTAMVDADTNYNFTLLPAGNYIVAVDTVDAQLPTGYGPTTPKTYAITLSTGQTVATADFGFGPALTLDKSLTTPSPAYTDEQVSYSIVLRNQLPGDGTANNYCKYVAWASIAIPGTTGGPPNGGNSANAQWQNPTYALGAEDDTYATTIMADTSDTLGLSGFNLGNQGGSIAKVELYLLMTERINIDADDEFITKVYYNNAVITAVGGTTTYNAATTFNAYSPGDEIRLTQDITGLRTWAWSDFANNLTELQVIGNRGGGKSGELGLDAAAYIVTTDKICGGTDTTITELPLTDTFDPTYLQFVSASIAPTSVSGGTITWANLGPLYGGQTKSLTVNFKALTPVSSTTNTALVSSAKFGNGRDVNPDSDDATVAIFTSGSIAGVVWADTNNTGWSATATATGYDAGDTFIPGVTVQLWSCRSAITGTALFPAPNPAKDCEDASNGGVWVLISTKTTGNNGAYSFAGLRNGYYNIVIIPTSLPSGFQVAASQRAEPYPNPASTPYGFTCGTCDNQWNTSAARLDTFNSVDSTSSADNITNVNFGYQDDGDNQGAVVGYVWLDVNADGVFGATEYGISGNTVYLCNSAAVPCNAVNATSTTTTDANGRYSFGNLTPGDYKIGVSQPTGLAQTGDPDVSGTNCGVSCDNYTTTAFSVAANSISGLYNFGYDSNLTIGDTLYTDWNGDGQQGDGNTTNGDEGEEGLVGVKVFLYRDLNNDGNVDISDVLLDTQTTTSNGFYQFVDVPGGQNYIVLVNSSQIPPGYVQTADPDQTGIVCTICDSKAKLSNLAASTALIDFGYKPMGSASLGDYVWYDADGDALQDIIEDGIKSVTINLYQDQDGDGAIDAEDAFVGSYNTLGYHIIDGYLDIDGDGVTLGDPDDAAASLLGYRFIAGRVDLTNNNVIDTNDDGLWAGYSVIDGFIDVNRGGTIDTADDGDVHGIYRFAQLYPTSYIVQIDPSEFGSSGDLKGLSLTSTGAAYTNISPLITYKVTLTAGQTFMDADFGFAQGLIGDLIWRDNNGNGTPDAGEPGISGVTVTLYDDLNNNGVYDVGVDTFRASVNTDLNGLYEFGSLPAGNYVVVVPPLAGYTLTGDPDAYGDNGVVAPPCNPTDPNYVKCDYQYGIFSPPPPAPLPPSPYPGLRAGQTNRTADFGYRPSAYLGDTLWIDGNTNGTRDIGESGIPFVTVRLCSVSDCSSGTVLTTQTDIDGYYSFGNIPDNNYFLKVDTSDLDFTALGSLTNTFDPDNTNDSITNVSVSGAVTSVVGSCSSGLGTCSLTGDFGYRYVGTQSITGTVFFDAGNNGGQYTSGIDSPYEGVTVYLWRCIGSCGGTDDVLVGATTTAISGLYTFSSLPDGTYRVAVHTGSSQLSSLTATREPDADPCGSACNGYAPVTLSGADVNFLDFGFYASLDFGDLPSAYNDTLAAENGARHSIGTVFLGSIPSAEADGKESLLATGDTDEGVAYSGKWQNGTDGGTITVDVNCPSGTCYLSGWVDWNHDNDFLDSGERILLDRAVTSGIDIPIAFNVPSGVFGGGSNLTFNARFRLYSGSTGGWAQPTGYVSNGEVEDYQWIFTPTAITLQSLRASAQTPGYVLALLALISVLWAGVWFSKKQPTS